MNRLSSSNISWIRQHLFGSPLGAVFSCIIFFIGYFALAHFVDWAIIDATWQGRTKESCAPDGACWAMVHARWHQFVYGFYPKAEYWRINTAFVILFLSLFLSLFLNSFVKISLRFRISIIITLSILILFLLKGGLFLKPIATNLWGGLFLTIFLSVGSILCAFPLAIILALGRQSSLIIIKSFCVLLIEIIRGVPLISILFMASVMLPLFLPQEIDVDKLLRAFVGIVLFQAAYMAEVLRGGIKSIKKGQLEAAQALGLHYWQIVTLILLPQAFRTAIPGLVNNFIALLKDTTLVLIIGIYDFLGIVQLATTSPEWLGTALEAYLFCGIVYWIICFSMSAYSRRIERKMNMGYHFYE